MTQVRPPGSESGYIVPPSKLVCTFEQSVKLREMGVPQNTYYYWCIYQYEGATPSLLSGNRFPESEHEKHYAAYTAADLAELMNISGMYTSFLFPNVCLKFSLREYYGITEAQARAELIIKEGFTPR